MLTPEELERLPKGLERLFSEFEMSVLEEIIDRLKIAKELTPVTAHMINRLAVAGETKEAIKRKLKGVANAAESEINRIFKNAIDAGYLKNEELYHAAGKETIPYEKNVPLQKYVDGIKRQTLETMENLTGTTGFSVKMGGRQVYTPMSEYMHRILDRSLTEVTTGTLDYNSSIKKAIQEMTSSGLRTVDYASGRTDRVDVAVRRAVMTGITQLTGRLNEANAEQLGTNYFEVSWHSTARPTHQVWQGRVYTKQQLIDICGLGTVVGLGGANCRHSWYPFLPGISKRTYTDAELEEMNQRENTPKEYKGKLYTAYEASQRQRYMERLIRKQKQDIQLMKRAGADEKDILATESRYRSTMAQYAEFSKTMGLPQQRERLNIPNTQKGTLASKDFRTSGGSTKKIKKINPEETDRVIEQYNEQIRTAEMEQAISIDRNGNVYYSKGNSSGVSIDGVDFKGATITHNHPVSNGVVSFGKNDFDFLQQNQALRRLIAVNDKFTYMAKVIRDIRNISYNDYYRKALEEADLFAPDFDIQHKVFEILRREGYLEYERTAFNDRTGKKD